MIFYVKVYTGKKTYYVNVKLDRNLLNEQYLNPSIDAKDNGIHE